MENTVKKWRSSAAVAAILLILIPILSGCRPNNQTAARTLFQMSTVITFQVVGPDAEAVCDELSAAITDLENMLSMFADGSDIDNINDAAGERTVAVQPVTAAMVRRAVEIAEETGGMFDVTIGAVSALWGVTTENPRVPAQSEIDSALALVDASQITVEQTAGSDYVGLNMPGMKLDPGGIAKGFALDACYDILERRQVKQAIISIGGNVLVYKDKDGESYTVGVRYPVQSTQGYFCAMRLKDTILSTTGGYERYFEQNGVRYHHVFDPRTGYPADSDILSVTVVMKDGLLADCTSTALFVAGLEETLERMRANEIEAVVMDYNGTVYVSDSLFSLLVTEQCDTDNYTFIQV